MSIEVFNMCVAPIDALEKLMHIYNLVPEFENSTYDVVKKFWEIHNDDFNLNIFSTETDVVGFICGYAKNKDNYRIWLTGVLPDYRGEKIAKQMIEHVCCLIKSNGYSSVSAKTHDKNPAMVKTLKNCGFYQTKIYPDDVTGYSKLRF